MESSADHMGALTCALCSQGRCGRAGMSIYNYSIGNDIDRANPVDKNISQIEQYLEYSSRHTD